MKVEAIGTEYADMTINVRNQEVVFKNNIADVPDTLGEFMVDAFPYFFPEGKVEIEKKEPDPHVFDQTKYEQQADKIVKLDMIIKNKDQTIAELKGELQDWKKRHEDLQEQFALVAKKDKLVSSEKLPIDINTEVKSEAVLRKQLEQKTIDDLKKMATELNVPLELVKKKTARKSWVDAILEHTFKL